MALGPLISGLRTRLAQLKQEEEWTEKELAMREAEFNSLVPDGDVAGAPGLAFMPASSELSIAERVRTFFRTNPKYTFSAQDVLHSLGLPPSNHDAVRKALQRLEGGALIRTDRGEYRYNPSGDPAESAGRR